MTTSGQVRDGADPTPVGKVVPVVSESLESMAMMGQSPSSSSPVATTGPTCRGCSAPVSPSERFCPIVAWTFEGRREVQNRSPVVSNEDGAMSEKRDYYDVLGVEKSASASDLKNAFRRLARKYHPDRSTEEDAEDRFKEIQEAYAVLSDDQKRLSTTGLGTVDLKVRPSVVLVAVDSTSTSRTSLEEISFPRFLAVALVDAPHVGVRHSHSTFHLPPRCLPRFGARGRS